MSKLEKATEKYPELVSAAGKVEAAIAIAENSIITIWGESCTTTGNPMLVAKVAEMILDSSEKESAEQAAPVDAPEDMSGATDDKGGTAGAAPEPVTKGTK